MSSKTYCKYPFREIAIKEFDGNKLREFWPCCMMGNLPSDDPVLDIPDQHLLTPQEMFDHPRMEELRQNLLNNVRDSACKVCWDQEDRGLKSFREYSNTDYGYEEEGLSVIDITASNICNLRCRMCTPTASHQLMADFQFFEKNGLLSEVERTTKRWVKSYAIEATKSVQWDWMLDNTDKIKVIKASGGEPFYDNKVIQLLKKYVETGNAKNTTLMFHTNATQFNDELVDLINQFKKNKHTFSIDGVGKAYEYIRYPATFDQMNASVINYINNVTNYDKVLNFTMVVSAHNLLNIPEYIEWVRSITNGASIGFAEIYDIDRGIALKHLPVYILQEAKTRIAKYVLNENNLEDGKVVNLIKQIDNAIQHNKENRQLVVDESTLFDLSRNQDYKDFLDPLLVEWMNND